MNKKAIVEARKELRLINAGVNHAKQGKIVNLLRFYPDVLAYDLSTLVRFYTSVAEGQTKKAKRLLDDLHTRNEIDVIAHINKDILFAFEGMNEVKA
jgi:hypothetical protein